MTGIRVLGFVGRRRRAVAGGSALLVALATAVVAVVPASAAPGDLPADLAPLRYDTFKVVNASEQNSFTPAHSLLGTFTIDGYAPDSDPSEDSATFPASYSLDYDGATLANSAAQLDVINAASIYPNSTVDIYNVVGQSTRASDGASVFVKIALQDNTDESMVWANGQRIVDLQKVTRAIVVFDYPATNTEDVIEVTVEKLPTGGGGSGSVDLSGITSSLSTITTQLDAVSTAVGTKASQTSVNGIATDVTTVKTDVSTVKTNLASLATQVAALKTAIDAANAKLDTLLHPPKR